MGWFKSNLVQKDTDFIKPLKSAVRHLKMRGVFLGRLDMSVSE